MGLEGHHLRGVLAEPWEVTREELRVCGFDLDEPTNHERVVEVVEGWRDMPDAYSYAVVDGDGEAIAVFGAFPIAADAARWRTWFLASHLFPQTYVSVTAAVRREMRKAAKSSNIREYECWTIGNDERARRWFATLGFLPAGGDELVAGIGGREIVRYTCNMRPH